MTNEMTAKEAVKQIKKNCYFASISEKTKQALDKAMKALDQRWIPVSERLPDLDGTYLVTIAYTDRRVIKIVSYAKNLSEIDKYDFRGDRSDGWYSYDGEYGYYTINNVIAWQPLPSPYKGE